MQLFSVVPQARVLKRARPPYHRGQSDATPTEVPPQLLEYQLVRAVCLYAVRTGCDCRLESILENISSTQGPDFVSSALNIPGGN